MIEVDGHLPVDTYCLKSPYDGRKLKGDDENHDVHGDDSNRGDDLNRGDGDDGIGVFLREWLWDKEPIDFENVSLSICNTINS